MVVLSLCLLYERPHARKSLGDYVKPGASLLPERDILPLCAVLWLSGQEQLNLTNIRLRFLVLCTGAGFAVMVVLHFSEYFAPMAPYLERIHALLYGTSIWSDGPYQCPATLPDYEKFQKILLEAMETIPKTFGEFSRIVEPPQNFYCPISPEGQWISREWTMEEPFPMQSNNAFGFVQDQGPSMPASSTAGTLTSIMGGYIVVPEDSGTPSSSTSRWCAITTLKTRGLQPNGRYPIFPEVDHAMSQRIYAIMGTCRHVGDKPYQVFSPTSLFCHHQKWLKA